MGRQADSLAYFAALANAPYRYDFYQTLRRLECLHSDKPRWGRAPRPADEAVRLGQEPALSFAQAPLATFEQGHAGFPPRLQVRLFGLLGPNGPMPLHITEYARERMRHAGDATLSRFLDIFHHRFIALFYRAWAQAQPSVSLDRPKEDRFGAYVASVFGLGTTALRSRDSVDDLAKQFHAGLLARHVRNADGLAAILKDFFKLPVAIEQFVGHWMRLGTAERTYLGREGAVLGKGSVIGERVWDRQHKFRIRLGPLTLSQYESLLPGGGNLRKLVDWVRTYFCYEFFWDAQLVLAREAVPPLKLGSFGRLGWTSWLGTRRQDGDADDLLLDAEAVVARDGERV